jgi:hypothetical protein
VISLALYLKPGCVLQLQGLLGCAPLLSHPAALRWSRTGNHALWYAVQTFTAVNIVLLLASDLLLAGVQGYAAYHKARGPVFRTSSVLSRSSLKQQLAYVLAAAMAGGSTDRIDKQAL